MRFLIIIPAYNEENYIADCLNSLLGQTLRPAKVVVVDDGSTDRTAEIVTEIANGNKLISLSRKLTADRQGLKSSGIDNEMTGPQPGAKVIHAFQRGLDQEDLSRYDVVCKYDADLTFPQDYLQRVSQLLQRKSVGIAGGVCSVLQGDGSWKRESKLNDDHLRGALKAYTVACFDKIGGLKKAMGWDTLDEMLARFHGYEVAVDTDLLVKHHKPTGTSYKKRAAELQGKALYHLGYSLPLVLITALKLAPSQSAGYLKGFLKAKHRKEEKLVTEEEASFIRNYRWRGIRRKLC